MSSFIFPVIFFIGIFIYFTKEKWSLIYWLILQTFSLPFLSLIANCPFSNSLGEIKTSLINYTQYYLVTITILDILRHRTYYRSYNKLILTLIIFSIYTLLTKLLISNTFKTIPSTILDVFFQVFPFFYVFNYNKRKLPTNQSLWKIFKVIFITQFIVCGLNLLGIYLFIPHYFDTIVQGIWDNDIIIKESKVAGTFDRYNSLANFLTTTVIFISILQHTIHIFTSKSYYTIICISFFIILITGAKISFLLFVIFHIFIIFRTKKNFKKIFIVSIFIVTTAILAINSINIETTESNGLFGINRLITGLQSAVNISKEEDTSTLSLSYYLVDKYFLQAPFFGNNLTYKGDDAYGNFTNHYLDLFVADARIALILVESGIIGLILFILCFKSVFSLMKTNTKSQYQWPFTMLFYYFLLLTITEPGFYDKQIFPLLLFFYLFYKRESSSQNQDSPIDRKMITN